MPGRIRSSRQRFGDYKRLIKQRQQAGDTPPAAGHHGSRAPRGPKHRTFGQLLKEFYGLMAGHRLALGFALATLTFSTMLKLIPPAATKLVIDDVLGKGGASAGFFDWVPLPADTRTALALIGGGIVLLSVVDAAIHLWGRWYATRATKRVQASVRKRLFDHAVRLPLHRVYHLKSGGVASILREDAGGIAELIFTMVYNPWRAVVQLAGSLVILAFVDWRLLLGAFGLLPFVFFTHRTWIGHIRPLYRDIRMRRQEIDSHATEVFGGMRVVRAFGRANAETGRFIRGTHLMARQELNAWWWARLVEFAWDTLIPLASAALLLYGGLQVLEGELSLGDLMMFLAYLAMLLGPLAVLANSATQFQSDLAGLDRVLDLLAEPTEMTPAPDALRIDPARVAGRITLRDISFQYPATTEYVLSHINLDVAPGELIALVGPSGAGKTTLCNLVARFYDPTQGAVLLDGTDLRQIDVETYRKLLGVVEQDVFLFDGTVAENIGYAVRRTTMPEIENAARLANAHDFILALPQRYDTVIGERGVRLSGGQRQRLAIARAVLADPRILILDEATSNLDTESERLIQQSLAFLLQGRTSFVIAHRLSTITHADRIIVLEGGQIVEQGAHEELLALSGRYRRMVQMQMGLEQMV